MCIRHHTHCSVESVVERGAGDPSLSSVCGRGCRVVETSTTHMSDQDLEDRINVLDGLEPCCSETPTDQYIIYNIKGDVRKLESSFEKCVYVVKNTHLKPSCHPVGNNDQTFPTTNTTRRVSANGSGLPAHPSQSGGQPTHLPLLPHTGVKRPTRRP